MSSLEEIARLLRSHEGHAAADSLEAERDRIAGAAALPPGEAKLLLGGIRETLLVLPGSGLLAIHISPDNGYRVGDEQKANTALWRLIYRFRDNLEAAIRSIGE